MNHRSFRTRTLVVAQATSLALLLGMAACGGGEVTLQDEGTAGVGGSAAGTAGTAGTTAGAAGSNAGSSGIGGTGGSGPVGGSSGSSGTAGESGTAGTAGEAGTAGNSGTAGESGTAGNSGTAGTAGTTATCAVATECPGSDTACSVRTCDSGVCGVSNTAAGTALDAASQTAGDCKIAQCDGSGAIASASDDSDLPDDQNPCTDDVCTDGVVSHPSAPAGTGCGGTLTCDGNGACTGCTAPGDCPGTDDECKTRTCDAGGACGFDYAALGTVLAAQSVGDCKTAQCDGHGATTQVTNAADLPVDTDDCTDNVCTGSTPSTPSSPAGTSCTTDGGTVCNGNGACVACVDATNCATPATECQIATCNSGMCGTANVAVNTVTATQNAGDCQQIQCDGNGGIKSVALDTDVNDDSNACTTDSCLLGVPTHLPVTAGTTCGGAGLTCDIAGNCTGCGTAADCPVGDACKTAICTASVCGFSNIALGTPAGTQVTGDCKQSQCDGLGHITSAPLDTDLPVDNDPCTNDVCTAGVVSHPPAIAGTACTQGGTVCSGTGTCVACVVAANCTGTDTECHTKTCNLNACGVSNAPAGTVTAAQTLGDCKQNQCDGTGGITAVNNNADIPVADANECTNEICTNGTPSHPNAPTTQLCTQGGLHCDGSGTCVECNVGTDCLLSGVCSNHVCATAVCGNGLKTSLEGCDDGNTTSGDGCSAICTVEPGYNCTGTSPSVCSAGCGDGIKAGAEGCDDGNTTNGDGCSATCTTESGYNCAGSPSVCATACGDGVKAGAETCDDGNIIPGDGCSLTCTVEAGFNCTGSPSVCNSVCGDGTQHGSETCDDGNTASGDGCSATCATESGYTCLGSPSVCTANAVCGNGIKTGLEGCDDGNTTSGDGCSALCTVELGYTCTGTAPSTCSATLPSQVYIVRVGTGTGALTSASTAAFIEKIDIATGANVGTITLPTAVSGSNHILTLSGSQPQDGFISRSTDGQYVVLGGYDAAPGVAAIAGTTSTAFNRVIGRIDAAGLIDTTTHLTDAFGGGNIRGAASLDGTGFWATGSNSGVIWAPLGTTSGVPVENTVTNLRAVGVFGGQLYASGASGTNLGVLSIGTGTPMTAGATPALLPGFTGLGSNGTNQFVLLDRNIAVPGYDTLYIADDRANGSGGGIQKWTYNGTTWTFVTTLTTGLTSGVRGITGVVSGIDAVLYVTTTETASRLLRINDVGLGVSTSVMLATAATNTAFRGVAFGPQ